MLRIIVWCGCVFGNFLSEGSSLLLMSRSCLTRCLLIIFSTAKLLTASLVVFSTIPVKSKAYNYPRETLKETNKMERRTSAKLSYANPSLPCHKRYWSWSLIILHKNDTKHLVEIKIKINKVKKLRLFTDRTRLSSYFLVPFFTKLFLLISTFTPSWISWRTRFIWS